MMMARRRRIIAGGVDGQAGGQFVFDLKKLALGAVDLIGQHVGLHQGR